MFLYREGYYDANVEDPSATELLIRKNRFGEQGTVKLIAKLSHATFVGEAAHV